MSRCECETEDSQQSAYSPGTVSDGETIVYALIEPLTSSVKLFSKSQLQRGELSVCRADFCTGEEAHASIVKPLLEKVVDRIDNGFLYALCSEIRSIPLGDSSYGAFCVVDDGLVDYAAHAHLGYSIPPEEKLRNFREAARGNLLKIFQKRGEKAEWTGHPFKPTPQA
jgi:hypothetical protein